MYKNLFIMLVCTVLACVAAFGLMKYNEFAKEKNLNSKLLSMETLNEIILGDTQKILKEENFQLEGFEDIMVEDVLTENYRIFKASEEDELSVLVEDFTNEIGYIINNGILEKVIDLKDRKKEMTPEEALKLMEEAK